MIHQRCPIQRKHIIIGLILATFAPLLCFALSPEVPHADTALPDKLEIKVGGKVIHGWRSAMESPGSTESDSQEENRPWEEEGFLYRPKGDNRDQFQVTAWSNKGRAGQILSAAEDRLIDIIRASRPTEDAPAGYVFNERNQKNLGGKRKKPHQYPKGLTVAKSDEALPSKEAVSPAPTTPAPTASAPKVAACCDCFLPWLLFILATLILILLAVRAAVQKSRR